MIRALLKKEAILLAILTSFSYSAAYLFELGYANYFDYPSELISINITSLLKMGAAVFLFLFLSIGALDIIVKTLSILGVFGEVILKILSFMILIVIFLVISYLLDSQHLKVLLILSVFFPILIVILLVPYDYKKKKKSFSDGLIDNANELLSTNKPSSSKIDKKTSHSDVEGVLAMFFLLGCLGFLIFALGKYNARTTNEFYFMEIRTTKYAIIKKYDSLLVTKKINNDLLFEKEIYSFNESELNDRKIGLVELKKTDGK